MVAPSIWIAFAAGILSFISPCILPILPGFMAYLAGSSPENNPSRSKTFFNSLSFVIGFSLVFALLGVILNTALMSSSYSTRIWLGRVGGIIILFFALHILGLINIPFLYREFKIYEKKRFDGSYFASFLFGASFAVGWSPCVGAILGSVFALAISNPGIAFGLLIAYAIGLGIPFLIVGLFTDKIIGIIRKSGNVMKYFNIVVGILLLILGVLVFTDNLNLIASFFVPQGLIQ